MSKPEPPEAPIPAPKQTLSKLEIKPLGSSLFVGDSRPLSIQARDENNQERTDVAITWASENPNIITVNPQGTVTAIAPGTATVTAFSQGISASIEIDVQNLPVVKLEIQPSAVSLSMGDTQQLQAIATDPMNRQMTGPPVTWISKSPAIAAVDKNGLVKAESPGTATIVVTVKNKTAVVQVTVSKPVTAKQELQPEAAPVEGISHPPASITEKSPNISPAQSSKEELKTKLKGVDRSELVYLSGITGEMAGKGDPTKFAGEAEQAGIAEHPLALELADLPKDRYGLVDWATAIKIGKVKPRYSLDPKTAPDEVPLQLDVVVFTKSQFMPDVIFPHYVHTLWLTCTNCHPAIFPMNAKEANKMQTMPKIAAGEFCGRCHNRIAFPLSDCLRCHVKPKDMPPVDPDYQVQNKSATP
ncbi:MAG: Ig-like domain-containing protein [Nitrospirae bacterium]|nr:Ig-like domain-containing protein [Nitrospirota bacterium]